MGTIDDAIESCWLDCSQLAEVRQAHPDFIAEGQLELMKRAKSQEAE
jgi:hypothetical protein